jgi:hypothetical protein
MNKTTHKFHGKEPNEGYFLSSHVKESRHGCKEKKKVNVIVRTHSGEHILKWRIRATLHSGRK